MFRLVKSQVGHCIIALLGSKTMSKTLTKKVERALNRRDDSASKRKELEEFQRLCDEYGYIFEPEPFNYSIEAAFGLPYRKKGDDRAAVHHPRNPLLDRKHPKPGRYSI